MNHGLRKRYECLGEVTFGSGSFLPGSTTAATTTTKPVIIIESRILGFDLCREWGWVFGLRALMCTCFCRCLVER